MLVEGTDLPLWGMEIDPEEGKREFMENSAQNNTGEGGACKKHSGREVLGDGR